MAGEGGAHGGCGDAVVSRDSGAVSGDRAVQVRTAAAARRADGQRAGAGAGGDAEVDGVFHRRAGVLRSRRAVSGRRRGFSGQRGAVHFFREVRGASGAASAVEAAVGSRSRLAGGIGADVFARVRIARGWWKSAAHVFHDSQSGVSRHVSGGGFFADEFGPGIFSTGGRGVFRALELHEGGDRSRGFPHDGERAIRAGNHDGGVGVRPRRGVARAGRGVGGDFERRRLRGVEHGGKSVHQASVFRPRPRGQGGGEGGFAIGNGAAGAGGRAAVRERDAADGSKGRGHPTGRAGGNAGAGHSVRAAGQRGARVRVGVSGFAGAVSEAGRGAHWIQSGLVASHRGGL